LVVAIEHENDPKGNQCWRQELIKLWHINCGLKVLITYNDFRSGCGTPRSISDLQKTITNIIGNRAYRSVYKDCIQSPFLFIFFPSCCDNKDYWDSTVEMYDAVAFVYDGNVFRPLPDIPILRKNGNIKNLTK
jgi:hypothetical protein